MSNYYPELNERILEMAEGDDDFRIQLISAIYTGLLELKSVYLEASGEKDQVKIQQIRHKMKPTILMFDLDQLSESLRQGKGILETEGFGPAFDIHLSDFVLMVDSALVEVGRLKN
jgi:hypothetical protein